MKKTESIAAHFDIAELINANANTPIASIPIFGDELTTRMSRLAISACQAFTGPLRGFVFRIAGFHLKWRGLLRAIFIR